MKSILEFKQKKHMKEKIAMITCYDYPSAKIIDQSENDCILVGDSVAMVVHGFANTTHATLDMMVMHTAAVARGAKNKLIIGDMPFMSYRKSLSKTLFAVQELICAGAHAIKLEGAIGNEEMIYHIVHSGVPVMGHIGLTPQHIFALGGFKAQGKTEDAKNKLMQQAKDLENAGCFALVLECVPNDIAKKITDTLSIPTIGIGAGPDTDGQVLVFHDLLGFEHGFNPQFLKRFSNIEKIIADGVNDYAVSVKEKRYPNDESY